MSAISDYAETAILNFVFNDDADSFAAPVNYIALYTVVETDSEGGTECSATSYARVVIHPSGATNTEKWAAPAATTSPSGAQQVSNAATITFAQAADAFGDIKGFAIWDHATTGNLLWHGALAATKTVGVGDTFKFATGALKCTLA
jgi:hypothetical protein